MPLDPRVRRFLDALAAANPRDTRQTSIAERRAAVAQLMSFSGPETPTGGIEERTVPGPAGPLAVRVYTPPAGGAAGAPGAARMPGLAYFHGGGLVAGSIATHDAIARALARAADCRVLSVDYRLAPEHPFPAAVEDATAAVRKITEQAAAFGIDSARFGICGDSAGGTLAAAVCADRARRGERPLALQLLLCPILDHGGSHPSRREFAAGYLVDEGTLEHDLQHYLPAGQERGDSRVSPLRAAAFDGLPRTLIHTAEFDPLRDEGAAYAARLGHAGVPVSYTCHPGMIHLFYGLAGVVPYARTAMAEIGAQVRAAWSLAP